MACVSESKDEMRKFIQRSFIYDCVIVAHVHDSRVYTVPQEKETSHDKQQILTVSGMMVTGSRDIVDYTQLNGIHRPIKFRCKKFENVKDVNKLEDAKLKAGIYKFKVSKMEYYYEDQVKNSTVQFIGNSYEKVMVDQNETKGDIFIMSICNYTCIYKCCEPKIQTENTLGLKIIHEILSRSNAHIDFVLKLVTSNNSRQYVITTEDMRMDSKQDDEITKQDVDDAEMLCDVSDRTDVSGDKKDKNSQVVEDEISRFFITD